MGLNKTTLQLLIALLVAIMFFHALPEHGLAYPQVINSGHAIVFFLAHSILLRFICVKQASISRYFYLSLFSLSVGILIEVLQPYFGRNQSLLDVVYDGWGIAASTLFFHLKRYGHPKSASAVGVIFLVFSFLVPLHHAWVESKINRSPMLASFDRSWESWQYQVDPKVRMEIVSLPDASDSLSAKLVFHPDEMYPGFGLRFIRRDWRGFEYLTWRMYSDEKTPVKANLRVHDIHHQNEFNDRFNYRFTIHPGVNVYRVNLNEVEASPAARAMSMSEMAALKIFLTSPDRDTELYLLDIGLE